MFASLLAASLVAAGSTVICIDPGHPSEVGRGTTGKHLSELELAWTIAGKLKIKLQGEGYFVVLTKKAQNEFVSNSARAGIANKANAALMVRLHCDAASGSGFTVYFPDRQGKSGKVTGPSKPLIERIKPIALKFHEGLSSELSGTLKDNGLKSDTKTLIGRKQGALTGSIFAKVPVVLVEMCVLTNPKDEALMRIARGQTAMVDALSAGVRRAVPIHPSQRK